MGDLIYVAVTVAFFLLAAGYVSLCNRIVGSDTPASTQSLPNENTTIDAGESADVDVTDQKGVRAQ